MIQLRTLSPRGSLDLGLGELYGYKMSNADIILHLNTAVRIPPKKYIAPLDLC